MQFPTLNGNWIDLIIIIFVLSLVIGSLDKGFLINLIDLLGFLISFLAALKLYPFLAHLLVLNFALPQGIAKVFSFIILGFTAETIFFLLIRVFYKLIPKRIINSFLNKIFGPVPALANALVITTFLLTLVVAVPVNPQIKKAIFSSKIGNQLVTYTQLLERELSAVFGEAVLDTLSFVTIPPSSSERVNLQFTLQETSIDETAETAMFKLINQERQKRKLPILSSSDKLKEIARSYGKEMFSKGYFSHISKDGETPFERLEKNGVVFYAAGENLAFAPTVELAHQGLMQSEGHRANILSAEFGKVGIGIIDGGVFGKMFVQEFTD